MNLAEGGRSLGRVLLFYAVLNVLVEVSAVLIFHAVFAAEEEEMPMLSTNRTQPEPVASLPFSLAVQDIIFNLFPDNIFTAPFRRFRRYHTQVSEDKEAGKEIYTKGFSPDPNILGLVIVSSALGVAIAP